MRFKTLFKLYLFILSCNNEQVGLASTTVNSPGKAMMIITMMIQIFQIDPQIPKPARALVQSVNI